MPYIYTLADEASRTGLPLMRPVFLEFPEVFADSSSGFDGLDREFLLGPDLLVAPAPFGEMLDDYSVSFPRWTWYDFWTGIKVPGDSTSSSSVSGNTGFAKQLQIHPALDTLPVYVRGGSILPLQPLIQSTDEVPVGPLQLRVYPGQGCSGSLYLDDGHTFGYRHGEYLRQTFTCHSDSNLLSVHFDARQGSFTPWWKTIEVVIYGWPSPQADAKLANAEARLKTTYDSSAHALHVLIPDVSGVGELRVESRATK